MPGDRKFDLVLAAAQIACVAASAWFVWTRHVLPRLGFEPLAGIAREALLYVTIAWICGAFIAFWVYFVVALTDLPHAARFSFRTSVPAAWFAPAIVLLPAPIPGAFAASLFLIAAATLQLVARWGVAESPMASEPARAEPPVLFGAGAETGFLSRQSAPVLMASFAAQLGAVALLWNYWIRAAALLGLSTAILTALSIAKGAYNPSKQPTLPHSVLSVVMTFLLAASLTFGGIATVRGGWGSDTGGNSSGSGAAKSSQQVAQKEASPDDDPAVGGDFPGVILLPELKPYSTIFVPVLPTLARHGTLRQAAEPIEVPFSGEYWMYRWPAARPPRRSIIRRGNAAKLSFHTTDGWPMEMEAHQKLEPPVDIRCCSAIQVVVRNDDPSPNSISVELLLLDSAAGSYGARTLGSAGPVGAGEQTITFHMRAGMPAGAFDELKVVFHREPGRMDKSARVAIERFVLER